MSLKNSTVAMLALMAIATLAPAHEGHDHEAQKPGAPASDLQAAAGAPTTFGEAIPAVATTPLGIALAETPPAAGKRLISGRIGKVCQNKGCWMTLHDGDAMVRVETGYRFAIPADAKGDAVVLGTLKRSTLDEDAAAHLRSESLDVAAGESWMLDAVGIRIVE